jgi:hypothetical protein
MNLQDSLQFGPEAVIIGGLLHLHWRMSNVESVLAATAAAMGVDVPQMKAKAKFPKAPLALLLALTTALLCGCASVRQTLTAETVNECGQVERRTLSVSVNAIGDAKQAVEKLRASNAKTLSVGVDGASQETKAPELSELLLDLLRKASK